jgi:hypothetical protein
LAADCSDKGIVNPCHPAIFNAADFSTSLFAFFVQLLAEKSTN